MRLWHWTGICLIGCGHPATVEECETIVERIAQLELQKRHPDKPELIQAEIAEAKAAVRESTAKDCVGRRITDSAMQCVRSAQSSEQIVEDCFDGWK